MAWGRSPYKFEGTEEVLDSIREAEPDHEFLPAGGNFEALNLRKVPRSDLHPARSVTWVGTRGHLVAIPAKNVCFTEGNNWGFGHAAGLVEGIRDGSNEILEVPAARVYRVTAKERIQSEKYEKANELSYQLGMVEPWTPAEQGEYHAHLLDGNHRAAAAMVVGDPFIYVWVSENTRENVYKKDLK